MDLTRMSSGSINFWMINYQLKLFILQEFFTPQVQCEDVDKIVTSDLSTMDSFNHSNVDIR